MGAITLATTVSSCSKDKGATPAQKTTETKKGLGIQVSGMDPSGNVTFKVTGYDATKHLNAKVEISSDDGSTYAHYVTIVTIQDGVAASIAGLDKAKAHKIRLSYTIPNDGAVPSVRYSNVVDIAVFQATVLGVVGAAVTSNQASKGEVLVTITGENLELLTLDAAAFQSIDASNGAAELTGVTVTKGNESGSELKRRTVTISGLAPGEQFKLKLKVSGTEFTCQSSGTKLNAD